MSVEQAKLFIESLKTDEEFRSKIIAVEEVAERIRLAQAEGYDCTVEEIKTLLAEMTDKEVEEIVGGADDDLLQGGGQPGGWGAPCKCKGWYHYR